MKKISIFLAIALVAIISSCGGSGQGSDEQNPDSLATAETAEQVQPEEAVNMTEEEKAELYKYFSQEEISQRMQRALTVLERSQVYDKEHNLSDFSPLYNDSLLVVEGFASSPKQVKKKWGKPIKKQKDEYPSEYSDDLNVVYKYEYPHFKLTLENLGGSIEWLVSSLSTDTPGYGFAGVYVGIPECNKAFIEKLFAKAERIDKGEDEETGLEKWNIAIFSLAMTELTVIFNEDGTVKKVNYNSANSVG